MATAPLNDLKDRAVTSEGCVEMVKPWQLCWTTGPLLSKRLPLASPEAQSRLDFGGKQILQVSIFVPKI